MHDDQHGTAIISAAALLNALQIQKKKIDKVKFVVNVQGQPQWLAFYYTKNLVAKRENFWVFDRKGFYTRARTDLDQFNHRLHTSKPEVTLSAAMKDADVFIGLSVRYTVYAGR
jgi:malate dehydrogenase (oxaloacetate-decarboxylating)(NADP+)